MVVTLSCFSMSRISFGCLDMPMLPKIKNAGREAPRPGRYRLNRLACVVSR
jgi:hypothetical protein